MVKMIKLKTKSRQSKWRKSLPDLLLACRTAEHIMIETSPAELMYSRKINTRPDLSCNGIINKLKNVKNENELV